MAHYQPGHIGMIWETDMNALSKDLRQRILNYALVNPVRETARIFQVSPNTVHLLKALWYETGGIEPRACQGRPCPCGFARGGAVLANTPAG